MFGYLIDLVSLFLVLSGMLLRAVAIVGIAIGIAMGVLWLIGILFPFLADALGLPLDTVYELLVELYRLLRDLIRATPN